MAEVINRALQTKPTDGSTQWSARSLAAATGISKTTVHRWLQTFSVQPHRQKHFKWPTDPFFVEKDRDIVGLYLNPPDKAMVLCVDEKTQIQVLDRTQPLLPMGLATWRGHTRLHAPWHHHPVHCPGRGHGGGADPSAGLATGTRSFWASCARSRSPSRGI